MGIQVEVERDLCIGSGTCVRLAPGTFRLDSDWISVVLESGCTDISDLQKAAEACPTDAIRLRDVPGD